MTGDPCNCDGGGSIMHQHDDATCTGGHNAACFAAETAGSGVRQGGDYGSTNDGQCEWSFFSRCPDRATTQLVYGQQYGFKYWYCEAHAAECRESHPEAIETAMVVPSDVFDALLAELED